MTLAAQSGATLREHMVLAGHSSPRAATIYQQAASKRAEVIADAVSERLSRPVPEGSDESAVRSVMSVDAFPWEGVGAGGRDEHVLCLRASRDAYGTDQRAVH